MNISFFIGHRGAGKTQYVKNLVAEFNRSGQKAIGLDLDEEIERREGQGVFEIFQSKGESYFRKLETQTAQELFATYHNRPEPVFISVGAGFEGIIPEPSHVIWLQRPTDKDGRIFLDRPRLNPEISAYEEYLRKFPDRRYKYSRICDERLMRPEGFEGIEIWDKIFFHLEEGRIGGGITLLPPHFKRFSSWAGFIERRLSWGIDFFELRDDLLEHNMLRLALQELPADKLLLSFRYSQASLFHHVDLKTVTWDWPVEKGFCHFGAPPVLSLHEKSGDLQEQLQRFEVQGPHSHLKLAPEIDTWQELELCHRWWMRDPVNRSFLPRSPDGRWTWYRSLFGHQMKIAFFREDVGSAPDQPFFAEWVRTRQGWSQFAAVLGAPVHHSRTPAEHWEFFNQRNMPVVAIPIEEREDLRYVLRVLRDMGLLAAAVTSPLKKAAFEACEELTGEAQELRVVNTLVAFGESWKGHNTDIEGFRALVEDLKETSVNVWGGGGTRSVLQKLLPKAQFYSARSGQNLDSKVLSKAPRVLIWAVPRSRMNESLWPPADWKPDQVIDLNYTMDSPGREYALKAGARYVSGLKMFEAQAEAQRTYWGNLIQPLKNKELE